MIAKMPTPIIKNAVLTSLSTFAIVRFSFSILAPQYLQNDASFSIFLAQLVHLIYFYFSSFSKYSFIFVPHSEQNFALSEIS